MLRQAAASTLALLLAGTAAVAAEPASPPPAPVVTVRDAKVTATLERAPVADVVAAIAAESGAEVRGTVATLPDVTLTLKDVPLDTALERILGPQSFTVVYDAGGGVKRITLAGGAGAPMAPAPAPKAATPAPPPDPNDGLKAATVRVGDFVKSNPFIPVGGRLGRALGTNNATFQDVMSAALKHEDPRVRAQARRSMVKSLTGDPEVREALVTSIAALPEGALANTLRSMAGDDADHLAISFARHGRSPQLSHYMYRALTELRRPNDG
jgi:hypothetical protein